MQTTPRIRLLPEQVINKIAAGEVVERPASVLKELVENSVDAGAARITVELAAGGRKLVSVTDDGSGMTRDEALLSVERHATSKIRDVDDIEHIATLGFRGEALAAIASVARFRLTTAPREGGAGTCIEIVGGKLQDVREVGCAPGTGIEVRDLFFNVPARRKFLRSPDTELLHLRQAFMATALGQYAIGFRLIADGQTLLDLAGGGTLADRIRDVFGADYLADLRPVAHTTASLRVEGFIGAPARQRTDRNEQYIFINGRPAAAPVVQFALREGYHTLMPRDRHPCVFLRLTLDPGDVDVNVHPAKREVRFRDGSAVRDAVIAAIRGALAGEGALPAGLPTGRLSTQPLPGAAMRQAADQARLAIADLPPSRVFAYPRHAVLGGETPPQPATATSTEPTTTGPAPAAPPVGAAAPGASPGVSPWAWCRVLGQIGGLYVIMETEDGYVLMDPHAAHERVLFDRLMAQVRAGRVASQALLLPETVALNPRDAHRVRRQLPLFKEMGFGVSEFGGDSFVVDALPVGLEAAVPADLLRDVAAALEEAGTRGGEGRWREEAIATAACKAAVKARDRLTMEEIERLVVDLARTDMPYTCPHGRPTVIYTSLRDLHRRFGRV